MVETQRSDGHTHKILAIEDDPEVLALYKSYLQKRGYDVLSASGAVEGMNILESNPDTAHRARLLHRRRKRGFSQSVHHES